MCLKIEIPVEEMAHYSKGSLERSQSKLPYLQIVNCLRLKKNDAKSTQELMDVLNYKHKYLFVLQQREF